MHEETTVAQGLYVTDDSAGYDAACKRVLSEKVILARIMKSCIDEYKDCDVGDIAEKYIEGRPQVSSVAVLPDESPMIDGMDTEDKSVREGTVAYDIRFRALVPDGGASIGLIINIEAQSDFYPGYPLVKRGIYYCCRMVSSQYGREFVGSHYENVKKVYSIWICTNPPKNRQNTIMRYRLAEERVIGGAAEPMENYDLLSVIMLCLGASDGEDRDGILRMLSVLLSNEIGAAEKRAILQDDYDIHMTQAMEREVSSMCNLGKGVMEKGLAMGIEKGMEQGLERGLEQGLQKGLEQGMQKGMANAILLSIKNMVKNLDVSTERAMAVLEIPETQRQQYRDLLKQP